MKIEIELPDPLFKQGDVVKHGPGELILYIDRVFAEGEWVHCNGTSSLDWEGTFRYTVTVQAGCGYANNPIRPGTTLVIPEQPTYISGTDHCLQDAVRIEWNEPIVEADSMENLIARLDEWKKLHPEEHQEKKS